MELWIKKQSCWYNSVSVFSVAGDNMARIGGLVLYIYPLSSGIFDICEIERKQNIITINTNSVYRCFSARLQQLQCINNESICWEMCTWITQCVMLNSLLWHWGNHITGPLALGQIGLILVNQAHESPGAPYITKHNQTMCIFHAITLWCTTM